MKLKCLFVSFLICLVAVSCATPMTKGETPAGGAAAFNISNLSVAPEKVKTGEKVMVGVTVANTGTQEGTYSVIVKDHDGSVIGMQDVIVAGGTNKNVTLHVSFNKVGMHMVMIDALQGNVEVVDGAAAAPTMPPMTMQPAPTPAQPAPAAPAPAPNATTATVAGFVVSALDIEPSMPDPGEAIVVSFKVTNTSGKAGVYHAEVKVNGAVIATKDVTLGVGETQAVNVAAKAPVKEGTYTFSVGDQSLKVPVMVM